MKVIRANVLGFCMGVRRAVRLAYTEAERSAKTRSVFTLGPLIHNPQVLEDLRLRGVETLDESGLPEDLGGVSVIIRAHGVSIETEYELRRRKAVLTDATCPRVKACQLKARALAEAGYMLFLAGEKSHAELVGILSYAKTGALIRREKHPENVRPCVVVGNAAEAERIAARLHREIPELRETGTKTALIGQTTISEDEYGAIADAIAGYFPDLQIARTICAATKERQDSLRELLDKVDAIVVAGGKESANTRRLFAIAEATGKPPGKPAVLAETARDIPEEFFGFETVGIAAGASTPDTVIDEIERALTSG